MNNKDLLDDDLDWNAEINNWTEELSEGDAERTPVTMLKYFSNIQEAHIAAAVLRNEGVDARVVSSVMVDLTPFASNNVRLFVATSQAEEAAAILRKMGEQEAVYDAPQTSSMYILMIVIVGIFVLGLVITLVRSLFFE